MPQIHGLVFLAKVIPKLLFPPAAVYVLLRLGLRSFSLHSPTWVHIVLCVLAAPVSFAARVLHKNYVDYREAAVRGGTLAPRRTGFVPGGIDFLLALKNTADKAYIGDGIPPLLEKYGQILDSRILWNSSILTTEPDHIKAILATQFTSFEKGQDFKDTFHSLLGTGVFNSDGDTWKLHRSMTRPFFSRDRISDFDIFERHAIDAIQQVKERMSEGLPVDFQDMVARFTLDSASEFLFGADLRSLSAGLPYSSKPMRSHPANQFVQAFAKAQRIISDRLPWWRLSEFWVDKVQQEMSVCYQTIDPILDAALAKRGATVANESANFVNDNHASSKEEVVTAQEEEEETLLDHLVKVMEDRTMIRDEILNIMIAGRDTTASTLTFAAYMLSQHPDILKRLREEVLTRVGSYRRPTYDDLREMKYLRAFINETLRLYPAVPFDGRKSVDHVLLSNPNGGKPIYIPPNTEVSYMVFFTHRRKDLWGPDAEEFDPDRFLDERLHKYLVSNPYIFVPFNAGPRICLGQQFAYNEIGYFLILLLQNFSSFSIDTSVQPPAPVLWKKGPGRQAVEKIIMRSHLTLYVPGGLWMKLKTESSENEAV